MSDDLEQAMRAAAQRITEAHNHAQDAVRDGDRELADRFFCEALAVEFPEMTPYTAMWRAMVLYRRGLNLLKLHGLEGISVIPAENLSQAEEVRDTWAECIDLVDMVTEDAVQRFGARTGFDLARAVRAVREDPLFNATHQRLRNGMLVGVLPPSNRNG